MRLMNLNELIEILLDVRATIGERDDAAMDLHEYNNDLALSALTHVAKNKDEDSIILNSCGESIAAIWIKRNHFDKNCYKNLTPQAKNGIRIGLKYEKPQWTLLLDSP